MRLAHPLEPCGIGLMRSHLRAASIRAATPSQLSRNAGEVTRCVGGGGASSDSRARLVAAPPRTCSGGVTDTGRRDQRDPQAGCSPAPPSPWLSKRALVKNPGDRRFKLASGLGDASRPARRRSRRRSMVLQLVPGVDAGVGRRRVLCRPPASSSSSRAGVAWHGSTGWTEAARKYPAQLQPWPCTGANRRRLELVSRGRTTRSGVCTRVAPLTSDWTWGGRMLQREPRHADHPTRCRAAAMPPPLPGSLLRVCPPVAFASGRTEPEAAVKVEPGEHIAAPAACWSSRVPGSAAT